jgi:hypothetical protein
MLVGIFEHFVVAGSYRCFDVARDSRKPVIGVRKFAFLARVCGFVLRLSERLRPSEFIAFAVEIGVESNRAGYILFARLGIVLSGRSQTQAPTKNRASRMSSVRNIQQYYRQNLFTAPSSIHPLSCNAGYSPSSLSRRLEVQPYKTTGGEEPCEKATTAEMARHHRSGRYAGRADDDAGGLRRPWEG